VKLATGGRARDRRQAPDVAGSVRNVVDRAGGSRQEVRRRTRIRRDCGWQAGEAVARRVRCDAVDDARNAVAEHVIAGEGSEAAARECTTDQAGAQRARAAVQLREDRVDVAGASGAGWTR